MNSVEIIAIIAIALIVGGALAYIIREKRRGHKCIGCPYAKTCHGNCSQKSDKTEEN